MFDYATFLSLPFSLLPSQPTDVVKVDLFLHSSRTWNIVLVWCVLDSLVASQLYTRSMYFIGVFLSSFSCNLISEVTWRYNILHAAWNIHRIPATWLQNPMKSFVNVYLYVFSFHSCTARRNFSEVPEPGL